MKFYRIFALLLVAVFFQMASAQTNPDTKWLYRGFQPMGTPSLPGDSIDPDFEYYYTIGLCDTNVGQLDCFNPAAADTADTGNTYSGQYINFNYQFTHGFAGFKLFWDNGMTQWDATAYMNMSLVHLGPLPGHKVKMIWGYSSGCGTPITYQFMGEFNSSTTWKKEVIPFPAGFTQLGNFELRFLVYDDSTVTTTQTSAPGNLKIDDIAFTMLANGAGIHPNGKSKVTAAVDKKFFVPTVTGKVTLAVYSLQGEQLYKGLVDVSAGKKYSVNQFALSNANLAADVVRCVQITGAGLNISSKTW
jgi:hypothetical protein